MDMNRIYCLVISFVYRDSGNHEEVGVNRYCVPRFLMLLLMIHDLYHRKEKLKVCFEIGFKGMKNKRYFG
jgi:hypothetical protein